MQKYMNVVFIERPHLERNSNLAVFSESDELHAISQNVERLADIIQARFGWAPFIIGIGATPTATELLAMPGTFELAWNTGLFCVPFEAFSTLAAPAATLTNFHVFDEIWHLLAHGDAELDELLLQFHQEQGLLCGYWTITP